MDPNGEAQKGWRDRPLDAAQCRKLKDKINRTIPEKINKRIIEMAHPWEKLPYYPPYFNAPNKLSVQGHEDELQELKDVLEDNKKLYKEKCPDDNNGPGSGSATAPITPPVECPPREKKSLIPEAPQFVVEDSTLGELIRASVGVGAAGASYWIISESLRFLFPPRNLIPIP